MHCPYCDGNDTQKKEEGGGTELCPNCGAPLEAGLYRSAMKCEYCGHYLIFEERVGGKYTPERVLPFRIGKKAAVTRMEAECKRRLFAPESFLSESTLEKMEGSYIPFFLYDMTADCSYAGTGTRIRVWTSGDTEYTETSYFQVNREMEVDFEKLPVDASVEMKDEIMDLMEPWQYEELTGFSPEYLSGFLAEMYNHSAQELSPRAEEKARQSAAALLHGSIQGYTTLMPAHEAISMRKGRACYVLLPVWWYRYQYKEKSYDFFVNGQTGKVVGKAPVSRARVAAYGGTFFACLSAILLLARAVLEVL